MTNRHFLFNEWGIGNASRNDGVLLLVARNDRKLRIELGAGYGRTLDSDMKRIIDRTITPAFRNDQYAYGIDEGVTEIIRTVTGSYPGEYDASAVTRTVNSTWRFIERFAIAVIGIGTPIVGFILFKAYRHFRRMRRRICRNDGSKMYRMTERDEDIHLSDGQMAEEDLNSIDYDVWACRQCDDVQIEAHPKWFSGYKQCPSCNYKTQTVTRVTMRSASTSSTGMERQTYRCNHCGHEYSRDSVIPIITQSDSGSSSSGGSFGGGSSGGGGASGSW